MSLKLNNFVLFKHCLKEVLCEFFATSSHNYQKAIILQLIIFEYLESVNHPILKLLMQEFSSLIEEVNETQLSLLSIEESKELANHQLMKEKFLLIPHFFEINKYFETKKYYIHLNNDDNESIEIIFLFILKMFKEDKFFYLKLDKKWLVFKPTEDYTKIYGTIEYKFEKSQIEKNFKKVLLSLIRRYMKSDD